MPMMSGLEIPLWLNFFNRHQVQVNQSFLVYPYTSVSATAILMKYSNTL